MLSKLLNLMGNQLIKGYNVQKDSKGQAGTGGLWRLYDGTKQGSNEPVSVFVIDKKTLKKGEKDEIIKQAKKQPTALAKFKHPGILSLSEPLVEDQNNLVFVTERVEGSLQCLIKGQRFAEICSSELEIRIQLLPLLQTINFLHSNVKMAHLAINPQNVYLMPDGRWKLSGFGSSQSLNTNSSVPYEGRPSDLSYSAPEMALQEKCGYASDTFSVMVLVLNLVHTANKKEFRPMITASTKQQYQRHREILMRPDSHPYITETTNAPALGRLAREALSWQLDRRCSVQHFIQSDWMNDNFILTIKHLQSITDLEQKRQLEFIKGMEQVLFKFETAIVKKRIIPALVNLLKFDYLIAVVLIVLVEIIKKDIVNAGEFQKVLFTPIKSLTQSKEIPAHALYVLVDNIDLWAKYMSFADLNTTVMPLYIKCFECPNKLKELALKKVEFLSKKFDYQFLKTKLLPRLLNMMGDKTYDIRKYSLIALYKIMALFDAQTVSDQILVGLEKNRKMGTDPFTNAITLKLYAQFSKSLSLEIIGNKIIPSLIPYLSDPSITKNDFEMYKNTIVSLINRIQEERTKNFSVAEGTFFTEIDFDFAKEEKVAERPQQTQANFDFLSSFKEQQSDISLLQPQQVQPQQAPQQPPARPQPVSVGGFDFGGLQATYTPPTAAYNPPTQPQPFKYEPPKFPQTTVTPLNDGGFNSLDFLGQPSTSNNQWKQPEPSYTTPTYNAPMSRPSPQKKQATIQEAAQDFFAGLDEPKPEPPKPAFQFKGPPQKPPAASMPFNPPPQPVNIPPTQHFGGMTFNITMNTGGNADPFAQLESELKQKPILAPAIPMSTPNYQNLLAEPAQPPKPVIKKPAVSVSKPPTTNVAAINNDDFFDLL